MKIFLIQEFGLDWDVYKAIQEAVLDTSNIMFGAKILDDVNDRGIMIKSNIKSSDLIILDCSDKSPDLMYQLGFVESLGKPIIVICKQGDTIPNIIVSSKVIVYDRNRLSQTLTIPLRNLLSHSNFNNLIGKNLGGKISEIKAEVPKSVFVSYSHTDIEYLERLTIHLKQFEKNKKIDLWSDKKINAGENWKEKIQNALENAAIAILLISADFLASDFITDNELPPLLKFAEEHGTVILPVIVRPCRFINNIDISKYQAINNPTLPLSKLGENEKEEVFVKIADVIDSLIK